MKTQTPVRLYTVRVLADIGTGILQFAVYGSSPFRAAIWACREAKRRGATHIEVEFCR